MKATTTLAAIAATAIAGAATAGVTYSGAGGVLNDAGFDNNFNPIPGVTSFDIMVGDSVSVADLSVDLDINHTWVGDLLVTLTHVDSGISVTLFDRPGVPESTFGNSDDLDGLYTFADGFAGLPEDAGIDGFVATGTYGSQDMLSAFDGIDAMGTWTLSITDNASGDSGELFGWAITVPAPGALALFGLAGFAGTRRRRG